jgi:hypothetical protein
MFAYVSGPRWHGVQPIVPVHCGVRYVFAPPPALAGFALLWHHTLLHVPADHVIREFTESVPAEPTLSKYEGEGADTPYGLDHRFCESKYQPAPPYRQFVIALSVNFTSTVRAEDALSSPPEWTPLGWPDAFHAWHVSQEYMYRCVVELSACVW